MTDKSVSFSVLDLAPIPQGSSAKEAFSHSLDLAQLAEKRGYHRYWLVEHHATAGVAGAATAVVIGHIAAHTKNIRVGAGGIAQMPIVGVIATAFDHYDSRAADPQLHTHVVVSNKVQGQDGRWRTLNSRRLHKAAVALSESHNALLTDHTARLLGVTWVPVDRKSVV